MISATIEIIIPVRNGGHDLGACLDALIPQLGPQDRVTVVDDGSTDDTAAVALARGVDIRQIRGSAGPYAARHAAAVASDADILLFIDARCRASMGLIDAHRKLLADPSVSLSCTDGVVLSGATMAERVSAVQQRFRLGAVVGVRTRLDYYPTANLGVRKSAYDAVGGFRSMRSGGDADLCWRIQLAGSGTLAADPRTLMQWQPRESMRDLISQIYRYGGGAAMLERLFPTTKPRRESMRWASMRQGLVDLFSVGVGERRDLPATLVAGGLQAVYQIGYIRGRRQVSALPAPTTFDARLQLV